MSIPNPRDLFYEKSKNKNKDKNKNQVQFELSIYSLEHGHTLSDLPLKVGLSPSLLHPDISHLTVSMGEESGYTIVKFCISHDCNQGVKPGKWSNLCPGVTWLSIKFSVSKLLELQAWVPNWLLSSISWNIADIQQTIILFQKFGFEGWYFMHGVC